MKIPACLFALILSFTSIVHLRADTLYTDKSIHITGLIRQASTTSPNGSLILPLTIPNILSVLSISGKAKDFRYYYDNDLDGYVVAPAGIPTGGTGTPTATVMIFGNTSVGWDGKTNKSPSFVHAGNSATGFNGNLGGPRQDQENLAAKSSKLVTTAIMLGNIGTKPTVVQVNVVDTY